MFDELSTPTNTEIVDETIQDRFGGSIDVAAIMMGLLFLTPHDSCHIINCVDFGHDLVTAAEVNASDLIKKVVTKYRVDFHADSATMVIDHTDYAVLEIEGGHTLIASDEFIKYDVILGSKKIITHVLFQGIGHSLKYDFAMSLVSVVQVLVRFNDPYRFRLLLMEKLMTHLADQFLYGTLRTRVLLVLLVRMRLKSKLHWWYLGLCIRKYRPWEYWKWFCMIDDVLRVLSTLCFHNVFHETNGLADTLAKGGVGRLAWFQVC
ncbi:hypothetical protein GQ457_07G002800 [Hibiscus cannabinus]